MKESAQAAMSYARANASSLGIEDQWFKQNDVHVHIPAGAIPKDGPSAGITISTSLISIMLDTPIRKDIAMTGEVTLSGKVLPVGGIKEKVLAAFNHGITKIILPIANKKDVSDIPKEFQEKINFLYVENLDEVIALVFEQKSGEAYNPIKRKSKEKASHTSSAA